MKEEYVLEVCNIKKAFGKKIAVKNISLTLRGGKICGMIGLNGAGKTTTLKMITGLVSKSGGTVKICGYDIDKEYTKAIQNVGISLESVKLYENLTARENLMLVSNLCKTEKYNIDYLLNLVDLSKNKSRTKVSEYSTGMKKRVELARALLNKPKLIILDEPTNGLDPKGVKGIYKFIKKLAVQEGISFIISSHILYDIERLCDEVILINNGEVLLQGEMKKIVLSEGTSLEKIFFEYVEGEKDVPFI